MSLKTEIAKLVNATAVKVNELFGVVENKQDKILTDGSLYIDTGGTIRANISDFTQSFNFTGSQVFTCAFEITRVNGIYAIEQDKDDPLKESLPTKLAELQYNFIAPDKIEITDEFETGDSLIIDYQHFIIQP